MVVMPKISLGVTQHLSSDDSRYIYAHERMMNFRYIAKLLATKSKVVLTDDDIENEELQEELSDLGQFSEIPYCSLPLEDALDPKIRDLMLSTYYPLEGYEALRDCELVAPVVGEVADLVGLVAYRPAQSQLVISISGTANLPQTWQDLRIAKHNPKRWNNSAVQLHQGFWSMYKGIRKQLLAGLSKGLEQYHPAEVAVVGHSMGAAIGSFLIMELMMELDMDLPKNVRLKLVAFGCPRCGNAALRDHWQSLTAKWRESRRGHISHHHDQAGEANSVCSNPIEPFTEYSLRAYHDGVPSIPPAFLGFRHFIRNNFYLVGGELYRTPWEEVEHSLFKVANKRSYHPKGGHNYYNKRDMERLIRRMLWLAEWKSKNAPDWQERYVAYVKKKEKASTDEISTHSEKTPDMIN